LGFHHTRARNWEKRIPKSHFIGIFAFGLRINCYICTKIAI
jgi:hypothetical protein